MQSPSECDIQAASTAAEQKFRSSDASERLEMLTSSAEDLLQAIAEGNARAIRQELALLAGIAQCAATNGLIIDDLFNPTSPLVP